MNSLRFLQFSDLHAGRALQDDRLKLSEQQRSTLRSERLDCLETIVDVAIEEGVELVLIPGDLYEEDRVEKAEMRKIRRAFDALAPIPVIITPGDNDYYSPLSWYRQEVMRKNQLETWPSNVHVFSTTSFSTKQIDSVNGLRVAGFAYGGGRNRSTFPDREEILNRSDQADLLLLHGEFDSSQQASGNELFSFSEQLVRKHPARYVAMGHSHQFRSVCEEGTVHGAFAGSPMGINLSETGDRHVLIGELTDEGVAASTLEKRPVNPRSLFHLEIEQESDISAARFRRLLQERFDQEGVRTEDLVHLRIHGTDPGREVLGSNVLQTFLGTYFHVEVDASRTRPVFDPKTDAQSDTTEEQFVREMLSRLDEASSEEQKEIVLKALRMGRSAFRTEDVNLDHDL